ncbi:MAG: DUF2460 domain-containing protein [Variovorax sp.]|nr:DUF2460 domain-containing protein [Variovorax sp.]
MSYLDAHIEQCPAYGWQGGPQFKTVIVPMASGRERRNADWANPRHVFSLPFRNIKRASYAKIKQMHLVCRGMLHSFKFKDKLDYQAKGEVFAQGDGVTTTFQLRKISQIGGVSYTRDTYVIYPGAVIRVGGTPTAVTIDADRGLITFASPPADGAVLSGDWEFGLWVRFNQDDLPFSIEAGNGVGDKFISGTVDLIEVPPPPLP